MKQRTEESALSLKGVRLSLKTVVAVSALIGFCGTLLIAPLLFSIAGNPSAAIMIVIIGPFVGALNGAFSGLIGYPIYSFLANRYFSHGINGFIQKNQIHEEQ